MAENFRIQHYPVFESGVFQKHPTLFDRFGQNAPGQSKKRFEQVRQVLPRYEETLTWPLLTGPGFCGATHPGADNVFIEIMVGFNQSIYNSDCLYVNPSQRVFAISDSPGITDCSRRLFGELDEYLKMSDGDDLETIVNRINKEMPGREGATLSLVCLPKDTTDLAIVLIAGDTLVFHGNLFRRQLTRLEGNPDFIGTTYAYFQPSHAELAPGDFFIIASDGISSIKGNHKETRLEDTLLEHLDNNTENFALSAIRSSNQCYEENLYGRGITRFGGSDNVSVLLVYPEKLEDTGYQGNFILGGYTERI
jgi:hypothetical protein